MSHELPFQNIPNSVKPLTQEVIPSQVVPKEAEGVETRRNEAKICDTCHRPSDHFYIKDKSTDRIDNTCAGCRRIQRRERVLGVTQQQYLDLHIVQKGRCGICRKQLRSRRYKAFAVDHDHVTGRIRGLLCTNCNTGLGLFKDDQSNLLAAVEWLKV